MKAKKRTKTKSGLGKLDWAFILKVSGLSAFVLAPILLHLVIDPSLRPAADDYCMFWHADELNFAEFHERLQVASSARHSYFLFLNIIFRFGSSALIIAPLAVWVLMLAALTQTGMLVRRWLGQKPSYVSAIITAGLVMNVLYGLTANQFQNYYWATGVLIYGMGAVFMIFSINSLIWMLKQKSVTLKMGLPILALSVFASLFNEPQSLFLAVTTFGALVVAWRKGLSRNKLAVLGGSILANLGGVYTMISSSGASSRLSRNGGGPDNLIDEFKASVEKLFDVIGLMDFELVLGALAFTFIVTLWWSDKFKAFRSNRRFILPLVWLIAFGSMLSIIMLSILSSDINFVALRTVFLGYFAFAVALLYSTVVLALCVKTAAEKYIKKYSFALLIALTLAATFLSFSSFDRQVEKAESLTHRVLYREILWDHRDNHIKGIGETDETIFLQSVRMQGGIGDLRSAERNWLNDCIGYYYGYEAGQLRALELPKD